MKQAEMKPLRRVKKCETCRGTGQVWGAVQRIYCPSCLGVRYQSATSVEYWAASNQELADELHDTRVALAMAIDRLNRAPLSTGPECGYYRNNGRGAGGSNYTGD